MWDESTKLYKLGGKSLTVGEIAQSEGFSLYCHHFGIILTTQNAQTMAEAFLKGEGTFSGRVLQRG